MAPAFYCREQFNQRDPRFILRLLKCWRLLGGVHMVNSPEVVELNPEVIELDIVRQPLRTIEGGAAS